MSVTHGDRARLEGMGLSRPEIRALDLLWSNGWALDCMIENGEAESLRVHKWSLANAYDMLVHGLRQSDARLFFPRGYTGHQLHLLYSDERSYRNMTEHPSGTPNYLRLCRDAPTGFIIDVLRAATSPEEADHFLDRYQRAVLDAPVEPGDTPEGLTSQMRMLASLLPPPNLDCHCTPPTA